MGIVEPNIAVEEDNISSINKKIIFLKGLDCADCALKIENEIKKITAVKTAHIDFISTKLIIEVNNNEGCDKLVENISKIVNTVEPGVKVVQEKDEEDASEELGKKKIIQFIISLALFFVPILFEFSFWVELCLYLTSYLIVGGEVLLRAIKNIFRGQVFDENLLMSIATIGAFSIKEFPEGVAVMIFYQLGEIFQAKAVNHSRKSIKALMDIRPDYANLKIGLDIKIVSPYEVTIGDIIIVKPGERIPLDGKVIEGKSMLDTSALTGESMPRDVEGGSDVLSGSINKNGLLTIKVTKEFNESTVSKILDLVQNASSKKSPTENFITKFAKYYTPFVVLSAIGLAVITPLFSGGSFTEWLNRALVFLVVSCPCALVISIPLGYFGGIGGASKNGILIKGSNYLEALNNVDTVVFDKTGTLTKGVFEVTKVKNSNEFEDVDILKYAAYAESYSKHPIAISILKAYGKEIDKSLILEYEEICGYGIKININDETVLVGNNRLMNEENIVCDNIDEIGTIVHVAIGSQCAGYIVISDELKEDSKNAIIELQNIGVKNIIMLTGDSKIVGEKVGKDLEINEVYAELLPHQKVEQLELLFKQKTSKGKIAFVGDGVNDAPVLARADVGIAMGGLGSDAAIEAADVILMTDEPSKIVTAIKIAKTTRNIIWQNIIFSMSIKVVVLLLGAGGIATMWEAVFADVGVAVLAILNAIRVMKRKY